NICHIKSICYSLRHEHVHVLSCIYASLNNAASSSRRFPYPIPPLPTKALKSPLLRSLIYKTIYGFSCTCTAKANAHSPNKAAKPNAHCEGKSQRMLHQKSYV